MNPGERLVPSVYGWGCHKVERRLRSVHFMATFRPPTPAKLKYSVYIVQGQKDGNRHIGFSTDLTQRLTAHFNGHVDATAPRRPLELIYGEYHRSRADALRREKVLQDHGGKEGP